MILKNGIQLHSFLDNKRVRKEHLMLAAKLSYNDLSSRLAKLKKKRNSKEMALLMRSLFNTSAWMGNSALKLLWSLEDLKAKDPYDHLDKRTKKILQAVKSHSAIDLKHVTNSEIFQAVHEDVQRGTLFKSYEPVLKVPQVDCTLVLISGVFNEIFTTPAFERAARHLSDTIGLKFISPKVYGSKSSDENSRLIEEQLKNYIENNPDEKLWILSFSKGGIDTLHFLRQCPSFAEKHIRGVSAIATPILGSTHVDHRLLKLFNRIHNFSENKLYKEMDRKFDLAFKDLQSSLSKSYQEGWFRLHHKDLPSHIFYTALALESSWHDSHIWMVLTKIFFQSQSLNDGVVDIENALYPPYFDGINLGVSKGHHLIGTRSSSFNQEALVEAHIIFLRYLKLI